MSEVLREFEVLNEFYKKVEDAIFIALNETRSDIRGDGEAFVSEAPRARMIAKHVLNALGHKGLLKLEKVDNGE